MLNSKIILYIGENGGGDAGALQADSVLFTSVDSSLGWGKIQFRNYARDDISFIQNSIIEGADAGVYCESASPTINQNIIRNNTDGVEADGGSIPIISNNTFINNHRPVAIQAYNVDNNISLLWTL